MKEFALQKVYLPLSYWKNINIYFIFIGKYLVVSEDGHEIVDLLNPTAKYELLANNVPRVRFATGGLIQNTPIVCGGEDNKFSISGDCVVIGQPEMEMKMIEKRSLAASVALDQNTLWIVGGYNGSSLKSTEFIKLGQPSVKGPDLPFTISGHSMIQYNEKSIYIIGGWQNGPGFSIKTWIVDPTNEFQITEGPSLNEGRQCHSCAKMTLNGRTILVVAGGVGNNGHLDSVEILDPTENNVWTQGLYLKSITVEYFDYKSHFIFQDQICH